MPKLIDSEAAKAAITDIFSRHGWLPWLTAIDAIDALPDASEGRQENITWVLEEDGLWSSVKPAIQQAGDGAEEET